MTEFEHPFKQDTSPPTSPAKDQIDTIIKQVKAEVSYKEFERIGLHDYVVTKAGLVYAVEHKYTDYGPRGATHNSRIDGRLVLGPPWVPTLLTWRGGDGRAVSGTATADEQDLDVYLFTGPPGIGTISRLSLELILQWARGDLDYPSVWEYYPRGRDGRTPSLF